MDLEYVLDSHLGWSPLHRAQVKADYLMSIESSEILLEEIGAQALTAAAYQPPDSVVQAIDAITLDSVVKVSAFIVPLVLLFSIWSKLCEIGFL